MIASANIQKKTLHNFEGVIYSYSKETEGRSRVNGSVDCEITPPGRNKNEKSNGIGSVGVKTVAKIVKS